MLIDEVKPSESTCNYTTMRMIQHCQIQPSRFIRALALHANHPSFPKDRVYRTVRIRQYPVRPRGADVGGERLLQSQAFLFRVTRRLSVIYNMTGVERESPSTLICTVDTSCKRTLLMACISTPQQNTEQHNILI